MRNPAMSAGTPVSPALLTPRQAAERLAISPRKLWALTASGEVASVRIGRAVRYDAADLADFIERAKQ